MCGHRGHTEGELSQEQSAEVRMGKEPLDVAMTKPGGQGSWVIYLTATYDVWLQGQRRAKGGIQTGADPEVNGADQSGEERDGGEGQVGGLPAVTEGLSLQ